MNSDGFGQKNNNEKIKKLSASRMRQHKSTRTIEQRFSYIQTRVWKKDAEKDIITMLLIIVNRIHIINKAIEKP